MRPFRLLAAASILTLSAAGAAIAFHTTPAIHFVKGPTDRTWPTDRSFQWQLDNATFAAHTALRVVIRSRQSSTSPQDPAISDEHLPATLPDLHEAHSSGLLFNDPQTLPVTVSAQLIDLNELALPNLTTPLRCLVALDANGATWIRGPDAIIQGDFISGWSRIENPQWKDNELHLLTFFTRDNNGTYTHNLLLQQKEARP